MKFKYVLIILFCFVFLSLMDFFFNVKEQGLENENKNISADVFFCKDINCENLFLEIFEYVQENIYCAFFDFKLEDMMFKLDNLYQNDKKVIVIVDKGNDFFKKEDYDFLFFDKRSAFMHNKFCVIDESIVITGSFNPTINGRDKNDNNILVIKDNVLAKIYLDYFETLFNESTNSNYKHSKENRNFKLNNIEICFSRGGNCLDVIKRYLSQANKSIFFMAFSFTDVDIENLLLYKKYFEDILIEGVYERSSITKYSTYNKLFFQLSNNSIIRDCNTGKMHHKVFVIDEKIIIAGSFNPSNNADKNNDENLIIISDIKLAEKYIKEYERIKLLCMT
jgi:phosphatidylserine/phosphatidylglycerophosphate/cardiolipin synthase-like enzyme